MNQVVAAAQARVAADFTDAKDLYMCLEIFNLDVWLPLLPLASSQSLRGLEGAALRLARKLRSYLDYFLDSSIGVQDDRRLDTSGSHRSAA